MKLLSVLLTVIMAATLFADEHEKVIRSGDRVVFLGDSNTYAGRFIAYIEAAIQDADELKDVELLNLGLSSETASGLSEPDHPFPRPCVMERLDRVLEKAKPNVVIACYGMNDAIYYPLVDQNFAEYKSAMEELIKKTKAEGSRIVLMTPPPFDVEAVKMNKGKLRPLGEEKYAWFAPYEGYNDVIAEYAKWILEQEDSVDGMVDLHGALTKSLEASRGEDPKYILAKDGVHFNDKAHETVANVIMEQLHLPASKVSAEDVKRFVDRQNVLRNAWLSHVGHKRPGIKDGLPLPEAQKKADAFLK